MIPTTVRHLPACSQAKGSVQQPPKPGVGVTLFKCRECGAVASSSRDAK